MRGLIVSTLKESERNNASSPHFIEQRGRRLEPPQNDGFWFRENKWAAQS